jgi:DNA-3-methyladenine glycosylase II
LSRPKVRYARAIAEAHVSGVCDLNALRQMSDDDASAALMAVKGIGRWTAETYLMFCEGRLDVFPGGDVALQEADALGRPRRGAAQREAGLSARARPGSPIGGSRPTCCGGAMARSKRAKFHHSDRLWTDVLVPSRSWIILQMRSGMNGDSL